MDQFGNPSPEFTLGTKMPPTCDAQEDTNHTIDEILAMGKKIIDETNLSLLLMCEADALSDVPLDETSFKPIATDFEVANMCTPDNEVRRCVTPRLTPSLSCSRMAPLEDSVNLLKRLGATIPSKAEPFVDASQLEDPGAPIRSRGGFWHLFYDKLHAMLNGVVVEGKEDIVSFMPHGRAFRVHDMDGFVSDILPRYFNGQRKWSSFVRQVNLYGFLRVKGGRDDGAYYHPLFLRGREHLARYMRRVGTPKGGPDRRKIKQPEGSDPDFYSMPPLEFVLRPHPCLLTGGVI